jgi:hypothetical protein
MAGYKLVEGLTYAAPAGEDLSQSLNRFVKINSDGDVVLAGADEKALGTLFEAAALGAMASVQIGGIAKAIASAAIAKGARVAVAANGLAKTGTTNPAGIALNGPSAANEVVSVALVG